MTRKQIKLVKISYELIKENSIIISQKFYGSLFDHNPQLRSLFKGNVELQSKKLMNMIDTAVVNIDNLIPVLSAIKELGKRHEGYGVKAEHYKIVGDNLLLTFKNELKENFTSEMHKAWLKFYIKIAAAMQAK